jgi:hypothetical protein
VTISSLLNVSVKIATVRVGTHQATINVAGNTEVLIHRAVEKLHLQDAEFRIVTD